MDKISSNPTPSQDRLPEQSRFNDIFKCFSITTGTEIMVHNAIFKVISVGDGCVVLQNYFREEEIMRIDSLSAIINAGLELRRSNGIVRLHKSALISKFIINPDDLSQAEETGFHELIEIRYPEVLKNPFGNVRQIANSQPEVKRDGGPSESVEKIRQNISSILN